MPDVRTAPDWTGLCPVIYQASYRRHPERHVLYGGAQTSAPEQRDLWQWSCYGAWRCSDGVVLIRRQGEEFALRPGDVGLCEPGQDVVLSAGCQATRVVFDLVPRQRTWTRSIAVLTMTNRTPQPSWRDLLGLEVPVVDAADRMLHAGPLLDSLVPVRLERPRDRTLAQARLFGWLAERIALAHGSPGPEGTAERAEQLMRSHLRQGVGVQDIAARLGMSRQTLLRRFAEQRGCSPAQALQRIKLEVACLRLRNLEKSPRQRLREAAHSCGYTNLSTFCRWFHAQTGMPPTRWMRTVGFDGEPG